jgi:hypothetical protein
MTEVRPPPLLPPPPLPLHTHSSSSSAIAAETDLQSTYPSSQVATLVWHGTQQYRDSRRWTPPCPFFPPPPPILQCHDSSSKMCHMCSFVCLYCIRVLS